MKAMILAAGLGTRLGEITKSRPKALVEVAGKPLIEHVILRLKSFGYDDLIINLHHFGEQIKSFVQAKNNFGVQISFSEEKSLLDTGGGLKYAADFFDTQQPFLMHNVDILSDIDLTGMMTFHQKNQNLATVAVRHRDTQRYILFDNENLLSGWESLQTGEKIIARPGTTDTTRLSFMGIHIFSPRIFQKLQQKGAFSIIKSYLEMAAHGEKIMAYRGDAARWLDLGRIEIFQRAEEILGKDFFE